MLKLLKFRKQSLKKQPSSDIFPTASATIKRLSNILTVEIDYLNDIIDDELGSSYEEKKETDHSVTHILNKEDLTSQVLTQNVIKDVDSSDTTLTNSSLQSQTPRYTFKRASHILTASSNVHLALKLEKTKSNGALPIIKYLRHKTNDKDDETFGSSLLSLINELNSVTDVALCRHLHTELRNLFIYLIYRLGSIQEVIE